jgi:hypothetical protein
MSSVLEQLEGRQMMSGNVAAGISFAPTQPTTAAVTVPLKSTRAFDPAVTDTAGVGMRSARNMGVIPIQTWKRVQEYVSVRDGVDTFKFTIDRKAHVSIDLTGLKSDANLVLFDGNGRQIAESRKFGTADESVSRTLNAGTYFVQARHYYFGGSYYSLKVTARHANGTMPRPTTPGAGSLQSLFSGTTWKHETQDNHLVPAMVYRFNADGTGTMRRADGQSMGHQRVRNIQWWIDGQRLVIKQDLGIYQTEDKYDVKVVSSNRIVMGLPTLQGRDVIRIA